MDAIRVTTRQGDQEDVRRDPNANGTSRARTSAVKSASQSQPTPQMPVPRSPPFQPRNHAHRFAMLSPPSELDLRSLPPTPQDTISPSYPIGSPLAAVKEDPHPSSVYEDPSSSSTPNLSESEPNPPPPLPKSPAYANSGTAQFVFPTVGHRRKTSTASQSQYSRASVASTTSNNSSTAPSSIGAMPPSLPVRSPLRRPQAKSNVSFTGILKEFDLAPNSPLPMPPSPASVYSTTTNGGPDPYYAASRNPNRPLPRRPSDPLSRIVGNETMLNENPSLTSFATTLTPENVGASSLTLIGSSSGAGPSTSKRKHALLELLSTERAYAADLALVKDIHIPLSRGLPPAFEPPPPQSNAVTSVSRSSPHSSSPRSSTHTSSSAQTSSSASTAASSVNPVDLPMSPDASKVIFQNSDELAIFADGFSNSLELALGDVIPGGHGEDCVGELFLQKIPMMSVLYKNYITRHPTALAQFHSLPTSPALTQYLAQTRTLVSAHSNAWDVPSFLIKPVQRLLKYPLLLSAIYNDTPESHGDKARLLEAKEQIEEVARMVNEGRRRWEVVKGILNKGSGGAPNGVKPPVSSQTTPPRVNRMRSFRTKVKAGILESTADIDQGKLELEQWERRIKECESVVKDLAKETLEWAAELEAGFKHLKGWNMAFGRVLGLGDEGLEAVGAFGKVVTGMQQLSVEFMTLLRTSFLPQLSNLLRTLASPRTLLTHMHTLRHSHVTLMNLPYNKSRPHSDLIEASNDYTALRATLRDELPIYLALFEKGVASCIVDLAGWQEVLWQEVRKRWIIFWTALASEGEGEVESIAALSAGAGETRRVWAERFEVVEALMHSLQILIRQPKGYRTRALTTGSEAQNGLYRNSNGSELSVQEREGRQVYQQAGRARSAQDLLDKPSGYDHGSSWDSVENELSRHSANNTPSLHSRHKRNGSASTESRVRTDMEHQKLAQRDYSHLAMVGGMIGGPVMISGPKVQKPKTKKESKFMDKRTKSEPVPMPRLVEPFAQDVGVGRAFAPALPPVPGSPDNGRDKKKKGKERANAREDDDTGSLRSTSPRPFRRLTDTLFGIPRNPPTHGRSKSRSSELDADVSGRSSLSSRRNSGRQSEADLRKSSSSAVALPPLVVPQGSVASGMPSPSISLDPPPSPLYTCTTIVPFKPDSDAQYMSLPMLRLRVGDTVQILYEAGHPSEHDLPVPFDDAPDCVLLGRDESNRVGWVLASYLLPLA